MQFKIHVDNAARLTELFREAPESVEKHAQVAINSSIQEVFKHATEENLPWKTGRLTRSFGEGIEIGRLYGMIGPTVAYAMKVHEHSSKPNYMPRLMAKSEVGIVRYFTEAVEKVVQELAS